MGPCHGRLHGYGQIGRYEVQNATGTDFHVLHMQGAYDKTMVGLVCAALTFPSGVCAAGFGED